MSSLKLLYKINNNYCISLNFVFIFIELSNLLIRDLIQLIALDSYCFFQVASPSTCNEYMKRHKNDSKSIFLNLYESNGFYNLIAICLSLSLCQDDTVFSYTENNPSYIVGVEISENKPVNLGDGIYTILPKFNRGLKLDEKTGVISGTPTEEYEGEFTVTYKDSATQLTKISVLVIKGIIITLICSLG